MEDQHASGWIRTTRKYVSKLPVLKFPFEKLPEIYVPQVTVLESSDGVHFHTYKWCYLERRRHNCFYELNAVSLSRARIEAMPTVMERLSKWVLFDRSRPQTIVSHFKLLSQFILWADAAEHARRFEHVLTNSDLALEALKEHHTYLRQLLQAHQLGNRTASSRDRGAIVIMSEIHGRTFLDEIEPLVERRLGVTHAPCDDQVGEWMSTLQAIFDSAARLVLREGGVDTTAERVIRLSATDDRKTTVLAGHYSEARLMELACVAFAGLAIGDSGANLAQIQRYEEPEDLQAQLAEPDRVNLTLKIIKFRAGGRLVSVDLTSTTISRLRTYLEIRARLVSRLDCPDVAPLFVQARFAGMEGPKVRDPLGVRPLDRQFLASLRRKVKVIGAALPPITLRQLRSYKQQKVLREKGVEVAAAMMGHSVATAVEAYCRAQEDVRRSDMGEFLSSLASRILQPSSGCPEGVAVVSIPPGSCKDHRNPIATEPEPMVQPDCRKTEGCFFCDQFRVHADAQDVRKLLSCRCVLLRLAPLQGESATADRVWLTVTDRIDALLKEIRGRMPELYEQTRRDVEECGNFTRYWAVKLQQLYLLGVPRPVV